MKNQNSPRSQPKFTLHPLIHTPPGFALAQDVENKKAEPKTPHFLSLNQDIEAGPKYQKCGLKYGKQSPKAMPLLVLAIAKSKENSIRDRLPTP